MKLRDHIVHCSICKFNAMGNQGICNECRQKFESNQLQRLTIQVESLLAVEKKTMATVIKKSCVSYRLGTNHPAVGTKNMPYNYDDFKKAIVVADRIKKEGYTSTVYIRRELILEDKVY